MSDIYKRASVLALTFPTAQGSLTVSDLWRIPLQSVRGQTSLDEISKVIHKQLKNEDGNFSLIDKDKKSDPRVQLQFDIIKDVIETRLLEREKKDNEKAEAERKQRIRGIIADKKHKNLLDMPVEELEKLLGEDDTADKK